MNFILLYTCNHFRGDGTHKLRLRIVLEDTVVEILISKQKFPQTTLCDTYTPEPAMTGRGGKSQVIMAMYCPPKPQSGQKKHKTYRQAVSTLHERADEVLSDVLHRTHPTTGTDPTHRPAKQGGLLDETPALGPGARGEEGFASRGFHNILEQHKMYFANTKSGTQQSSTTWRSSNRTSQSSAKLTS